MVWALAQLPQSITELWHPERFVAPAAECRPARKSHQ
jgi:hypothetical protein